MRVKKDIRTISATKEKEQALAIPREDTTVLHPETRGEHIAYWISQIGSPPVMVLAALILTSLTLALPGAWIWVAVYVALALGIPLSCLVWLFRRGKVTDLDVHLREQRRAPMIATLIGLAVGWLVLYLGRAPDYLQLLAGISFVQTLLLGMITLRWKISVHTTTAAGMTITILSIMGLAAAPLVITVPLVAWSRVKLQHHTAAQTIAGTALGSAVSLAAVLLLA